MSQQQPEQKIVFENQLNHAERPAQIHEELSLGSLTKADQPQKLSAAERKMIEDMCKHGGKEAQDLMMRCPVAGKQLKAEQDKKKDA